MTPSAERATHGAPRTGRRAAHHLATCSALALIALPGQGALGQEATAVFTLDPITVEQRDELGSEADRATSMYVSERELEQARTGDLKDVFSGIASVSVGGALPLTQKIYVNGVDMLNLGVTLDGTAQNNRAFHHVSANAIDPGLLKQVRADATVSPADAGPYALAGSVVFETVDAADILDTGANFGGNLRLSYSDNGETLQTGLTLAGREGGFEWLLYGKLADGEDYTSGGGDRMHGTRAALESYLAKVAYEAGGHRLEVSAQRLQDNALRQERANFGGFRGVSDALIPYDTTRSSYALSYEQPDAIGLWDPRLHIGFSESLIDKPEPYDSNGTSNTLSMTAENTFHLGAEDTVTAGVDFQRKRGHYFSEDATYPADDTESSRNLGVFAQARLRPTEALKVSFGARFDRQDFTGVNGFEKTFQGVSGNASLTYAVTEALALRGGVSSVFGGLVIEDNYLYEGLRAPGSYDALDAVRADNATLGFDWTQGALTLSGEVFVTRMDNARSSTSTFDFESRGFNLGATYGWGSGFARATLAHSEVRVDGTIAGSWDAQDFGTPIGTVMAFEIEQETRISGLTLGGGLDIALDEEAPDPTSRDYEGYTVVNLWAEYVPPSLSNLTLRAEVSNLFDVEYADRATYGAEYDTITTLKEPGRTISLVAVTRF
ncbi:TonB-dependent receptor plug domain-containing protein [Oceanicola sp. S124]|uniref:TonB-dependent receptor plug domain-containing protein n=1 Tax=Oceanicola sp. S124 TaxID=1042378 RepID=UPI0002559A1D|nr:TonB-dependent receptor [Oceanicola sp. S124]